MAKVCKSFLPTKLDLFKDLYFPIILQETMLINAQRIVVKYTSRHLFRYGQLRRAQFQKKG